MHLPPKLLYPFVRLGARLFGGFNLDENSPKQAVKNTQIPVILIHGASDDFVPASMSQAIYESCQSKHKKLVFIEGAGHGLAYPDNPEGYIDALLQFDKEYSA